jgi:hypothetical protein
MSEKREKKILRDFDKQVSELYYTPQEAQKILGMSRDTFNNYVRRGSIKRYTFVGPHGFFLRSEIDGLAERIEAALLAAQIRNYSFRRAELGDLDLINYLAYTHFGEGALTPERKAARRRFLEANPDSTFCLFDSEQLLASIDIVPLTHDAILEFREGKRGWQFSNEQIEQYKPGYPLELIIIDMMVTLRATPQARENYAGSVLRGLSRQFKEWGSQDVEIKSIDASGGTELGKHILESAGFKYMGEKQPNRHIYHLDVDTTDLKLLKPYKAALTEWKHQHNQ